MRSLHPKRVVGSLKVVLVLLDCLFLAMQPILVHLSKNSTGNYSFQPMAVNFLTELAKTIYAAIVLLLLGSGRQGPSLFTSARSFAVDAHHNRLLLVPALLYAINNYLKFIMQLFFNPTSTKMLGNFKIFTIALLMRLVMKRSFNVIQWEALFLLVVGITVNQLAGKCPVEGAEEHVPLIPATLSTIATTAVPSAASVYNEFALKKHMDTSVHLQNFFLYFYGMLLNLGALLAVSTWKGGGLAAMFEGQSGVTLLIIANNGAQGILSSFFYKYADTILKKYSSTIATVFTGFLSYFMFGHQLTLNFFLGVSVVLISMHQFFTFGGKAGSLPKAQDYDKDYDKAYDKSFEDSKQGLPTRASAISLSSAGRAGSNDSGSLQDGGGIVYSPSMDHIVSLGGSYNTPGSEGPVLRSGAQATGPSRLVGFRGGLDPSSLRQERSGAGSSDAGTAGGLNGGWVAIKPQAGGGGRVSKGGWLDV